MRCEFCNKELNKRYLTSHIKKQHYNQHFGGALPGAARGAVQKPQLNNNNEKIINNNENALCASHIININDEKSSTF